MEYRVKFLTSSLSVEEQVLQAADQEEVRRVVEADDGRVLSVTAVKFSWRARSRTSSFDLAIFNQQLFSLLDAGQTLVDSLELLGRNDRRGRNRKVFDVMLRGLRSGRQLSETMATLPFVFPGLYVAMVRSSETTGTIKTSVRRYMHYQRQVDEIRRRIVSAAVYPAVLLGVGGLVVAFLMLYVVPRFSAVYDDAGTTIQFSTGFVQIWGGFVRRHGVLAWSLTGSVLATIVFMLTTPALRLALLRRALASPWIGDKLRMLQLARLFRTLGMLLRSGVGALPAMRMAADALPPNMQGPLHQASQKVSEGLPMSSAFAQSGLSTEVSQRLLVAGESSGNLAEMMEKIADFYDQEIAQMLDTGGRLIEPALMIGIGLVIGAVVLMLYMPIFDLTGAVS